VKRLALFWLLCAAAGFAVAAGMAMMLALAFDSGGAWREKAQLAGPPRSGQGAPRESLMLALPLRAGPGRAQGR
jgi:hypothetical protein